MSFPALFDHFVRAGAGGSQFSRWQLALLYLALFQLWVDRKFKQEGAAPRPGAAPS
ncbi:hypothetical protein [Paraburkholderia panacisoli]|uniref:hypothetical protein n=1 Tax=Paraburkholderia panacisoli TaxID=2603818 RepID=UPI00165F6FDA|nr:hypothetical protein [Paraburkholderia panacisoli]